LLQAALYCLLFIACVAINATIPSHRTRQIALLIASYALYLTWTPWFALILLASTIVNFLIGKWLRRNPAAVPLALGTLLNLLLLGTFKYLPEAASHSTSLQNFSHIAMPLGISFWTFQAMSYLFDLYRSEELDPSFIEFALYMAFFPVTISGPICRVPDMLPQFRSEQRTARHDIFQGFRRIAIGVFMVQLAKLLGQGILGGDGITSGFDHVTHWTAPDVWCLAFGYGLQLFLDFAGYSHIAIGAAKALGVTVPENFVRPFESTNASIFWTRWHMSLSFWIRDYVFLPLATARREMWWRNLALVISMVVFGLWHRATWLFLLWGAYHGILLVLHRQTQQLARLRNWEPGRFWTPISWIVTMSVINLGWIFFRSNSLQQARQMLIALVSPHTYATHVLTSTLYWLVAGIAGGYALVILAIDALNQDSSPEVAQNRALALLARSRWYWLPPIYGVALIFLLIVTFTRGPSTAQFMYNKF
jgi:alginate O-acetyltransferase complex protein AlgI